MAEGNAYDSRVPIGMRIRQARFGLFQYRKGLQRNIDERTVRFQGFHVLQIAEEQHYHKAVAGQSRREYARRPRVHFEKHERPEILSDAGQVEQPRDQRHQHAEQNQDEGGIAVFEQQPDGCRQDIQGYEEARELHFNTKID